MSRNIDRIKQIASESPSKWLLDAEERRKKQVWSKRSFQIAVKILAEIKRQNSINGMTQKMLAEKMGVSPQYINKVVKGKENLTLETISRIEEVLGVTLIQVAGTQQLINIPLEPINSLERVDSKEAKELVSKKINLNPGYLNSTGTNG